MYCEICKRKISVRKHLFNIFKRQTHHICEMCYDQYPLIIKRSRIYFDGGEVIWQSLIQTYEDISPLAHMSFYKPFIIDYINHYKTYILWIDDRFEEEKIDIFEKLKLGDIYLITLYDNIEKKGD
jgi:hypothetical protein